MVAVHIAYSRTRAIFRGITTVFLMMAGALFIFFGASRVSGTSEISMSGAKIAHADAPLDPTCVYVSDANGNVTCVPPNPDYFVYVDPGCGCGCGCGF